MVALQTQLNTFKQKVGEILQNFEAEVKANADGLFNSTS